MPNKKDHVSSRNNYVKPFCLFTKILLLKEFHHIVPWMVCVFDSYVALSVVITYIVCIFNFGSKLVTFLAKKKYSNVIACIF